MMARSTNAPFKGRIQKRKTSRLQIIKFSLQRTAGPYKGARCGSEVHMEQRDAYLIRSQTNSVFGLAPRQTSAASSG